MTITFFPILMGFLIDSHFFFACKSPKIITGSLNKTIVVEMGDNSIVCIPVAELAVGNVHPKKLGIRQNNKSCHEERR